MIHTDSCIHHLFLNNGMRVYCLDLEICRNILSLLHALKDLRGLSFLQRVSIACYAERCTSYSKSVRPSVHHTLALCQNDSSYDHGIFTVG